MTPTTVIRGFSRSRDRGLYPSASLEVGKRLMETVAGNPEIGDIVRIYRPAPTLAFTRREEALPGFGEAVSEAMAFGFEPVIRPTGGRMVALDENWLILEVISPEARNRSVSHRSIFEAFGAKFVELLTSLGVHAAMGAVPGEYCPGEFSINARGEVKIVGTSQRVTRGARLFSASIPYSISPFVAELFDRVNGLLDLEWDARRLGSVETELPAVTIGDLERALHETFVPHDYVERSLADIFSWRPHALAS